MRLNAKQLREVEENDIADKLKKIRRNPIYFILENIYDTYNIGGLFRLADALAIEKMYICGDMETPPNSRIMKASIGTYKVVPWEYKTSAKEAIDQLRLTSSQSPIQVIAVEQDQRSINYYKIDYTFPIALVLGNETSGILPETLDLCDNIAEIPMWGVNKSLNVIVSAAIVSYWVVDKLS